MRGKLCGQQSNSCPGVSSESPMPMGMAAITDAIAPLCGGAHGETPEMAGMVETGEIPETLEIFEPETFVMPETTETPATCETFETPGISEIQGTCGTLVTSEIFVTHGSRCTIDTGTHGT